MSKYIWEDKEGKKYHLKDIDNNHLINILNYIYNYGYINDYLAENKIKALYGEAKRRKLQIPFSWKELVNELNQREDYRYYNDLLFD